MKLVPVILSGGIGSRLWPYSRADFPKPFIPLPDGSTLFAKTMQRAFVLPDVSESMVVCNQKYTHLTNKVLQDLDIKNQTYCIWEPCARNTAAAIAVAAKEACKIWGKDTILLVLPSDHLIRNEEAFSKAVSLAVTYALQGKLVTFGIEPDSIETGYGYIEHEGTRVLRFIEKPDFETAKSLISTQKVVWNAGMFCFMASKILEEIESYFPELGTGLNNLSAHYEGKEIQFNSEDYLQLPEQSIE